MIRRVLLVKLTSLGDLIHALPALSDALAAHPQLQFDWLIDESFQEVASWHPAVKNIYTTNHRAWRSRLLKPDTYRSIYQTLSTLRKNDYDLIIDGQGNFKSALLTLCMNATRAGFDKHSIREKIAHLAYHKKYAASWDDHAIVRLRTLFGAALGYPLPQSAPNFGLSIGHFKKPNFSIPERYLFFVPNASWESKLWPEAHWHALIQRAASEGFTVLLPWGSLSEEVRAKKLGLNKGTFVLPRLSLSEIGYLIHCAIGCVSVDTGLSHLAAALNVPTITLYGSTDAGLIGASGGRQIHIQSDEFCAPCHKKTCPRQGEGLNPPCLARLNSDSIWNQLRELIT